MTLATHPAAFAERRARLARALEQRSVDCAACTSGWARPRNFAHNVYPFRAESHFLYLTGLQLEGAILLYSQEQFALYVTPQEQESAIWEGAQPSAGELEERLGLPVRPVDDLRSAPTVALLPPQDEESALWLEALFDRPCVAQSGPTLTGADSAFADAMVELRLRHDESARAQLRLAASGTARAHVHAMKAGGGAPSEGHVRGQFIAELLAADLDISYEPIVTKRGEVLHGHSKDGRLLPADLMLCDVGGETSEGWGADLTRTWPVSGQFTVTQRTLYQLVLDIQKELISAVAPGKEYAEIHDLAHLRMTESLKALGLLRGSIDELMASEASSVFLPHGIGHLLGLDVHDMEDLGDRAGYPSGRLRKDTPSRRALRLDRPLEAHMLITIEPGFYLIPPLLERAAADPELSRLIDFSVVRSFSDVRGIRIEDDVLVTATGAEVLTRAAPKEISEIEELMGLAIACPSNR